MLPAIRPADREDDISQIPALHLLQTLGYSYLTPAQALAMRGGRKSNVFLDSVLEAQLKRLNRIRFKNRDWEFSEANIQSAIDALKSIPFDGLVRTNAQLTDLLLLGKSLPQTIEGDTKSFSLRYVDWNPATWTQANAFHVSEEFEVERTGSHALRRPDLVLFVNGIPFAVIECKRPSLKDPIAEAISQMRRNGRGDEIPRLFAPAQLLLALSKNEASYGTVGTERKFWSVWKEPVDDVLAPLVSAPLDAQAKARMMSLRTTEQRALFDELESSGRLVTEQDRALYCLARPERLLDLARNFTLLDAGEKKVARYQQFFCVRKTIERIRRRNDDGSRRGGVVWHTQGSGKSLTMVMLARAIALEPGLAGAKIVLVTDRVDLDNQIYNTFKACDIEPVKAQNGRDLAAKLADASSRVITTVIDKFETAAAKMRAPLDSPDIFVLVDESHRGQYGAIHSRMRSLLPRACFIGFTGTPVKKGERDTVAKFGGLIDSYTIRQAVEDKAVVPLLYEGRDVEQTVDKAKIDREFERETHKLSPEQKADLKKKFATTDQLHKTEQKVREIAWDISHHFRDASYTAGGAKAQLVAPNKATALLYHKYLQEIGIVSSEVLISGPDEREGYDEAGEGGDDEAELPAIISFWRKMMARHGSEEAYNKNTIAAFKSGGDPQIIIVVDKLLTGFDEPRNTVLYLARQLKDHTLLQAIARVNRLREGKDFGYIIDYRGVLQNLNRAFDMYSQLEGFEAGDLEGTVSDVAAEVALVGQRHTDVWSVFGGLQRGADEEKFEQVLGDAARRDDFYERLSRFARTLGIALSSQKFMEQTGEKALSNLRGDLRFFARLRDAVRRRYAESVDFREYEPKIQKLLDLHVGTGEVEKVTSLVNIFDHEAFQAEVEKLGSAASKADTIAHRAQKTVIERMDEDPAFYSRFSKMLQDAISAFREKRLADSEYLAQVVEIAEGIRARTSDDLPQVLEHEDVARAFYGVLRESLSKYLPASELREAASQTALEIDAVVRREIIVSWTRNEDVKNRIRNGIEDLLHDLGAARGIELSFDEIDAVLERCLDIARARYDR